MPTNNSRSISAVARLFRAIPVETLKAEIADIEDMHSDGGDSSITRQEALGGGTSEGMRGGNADQMVRRHSDLDAQRGRQAEYEGAVSGLLADIAKAMKAQTDAIAALVAPKVAAKAVETDTSYLTVVEKSLKIAAREIFKAETDEDDEDKDSKKDKVEKAERHLAKAAKLLAKAEESDEDDSDEDKIEKARTDIRRLTKSLKPFREAIKSAADAVAKAEADAVAKAAADKATADALVAAKAEEDKKDDKKEEETAKSDIETRVASIQDQFGMVTKSVSEMMELVSGLSRGAKQPNFVAKAGAEAKTDEPVDFTARAEEAADSGRITTSELIKCNNIISRMSVAKSGNGGAMNDLAAIKTDILTASSGVREVFASLLTA